MIVPLWSRETNTPNTCTPSFLRCIQMHPSPAFSSPRPPMPFAPISRSLFTLSLPFLLAPSTVFFGSLSSHFCRLFPSLLLSTERVPLPSPFFHRHSLDVIYYCSLLSFWAVVSLSFAYVQYISISLPFACPVVSLLQTPHQHLVYEILSCSSCPLTMTQTALLWRAGPLSKGELCSS